MSLREASKLSGISYTHIRDIEDGRSVLSFEMGMKFLGAYWVAIEAFLRETGYLSSREELEGLGVARRVPVISWAQADNWLELCDNFQYGGHEEYVETDSKGVFALKVRGNSMETEFREGDIIVINPYLKPEHNDYVVIANDEGAATFRQLKNMAKPAYFIP